MIYYKNQNVILNVLNTLTNVQSRAHTRNTPRILIDAVEARSAPWRWCRYRVDAGFTIGRWSLTGQLVVGLAVGNIRGFFSSSNFISQESIEDVSQSYQTIFIFKRGKKKQLGQPSRCVVEVSVPNMGTLPKSTYLCVGGSLWVQRGEYVSAEWIKVEKKWSCRLDWI